MTFPTYEESVASGNPVQCYLFRYGTEPGEYYAYTTYTGDDLVIDHGGSIGEVAYTPVPIQRDAINANGTLDKSALRIGTDIGTDLAEIFRVYPPSNVVTLTVYEGHIDDEDLDFRVVWAGRVVAAQREKSELTLSCEPVSTQMRRPGLRRNYQFGCGHALYMGEVGKPGCHANKAAATVIATVASVAGSTVTLDSGWEGAFPAAKFLRGMLEWTPAGASIQRRTIIRIAGDVLTLSGIATDLVATDSVDVVLGCNHKAFAPDGDCQAIHDNLADFGGEPWIPLQNVIGTNPFY